MSKPLVRTPKELCEKALHLYDDHHRGPVDGLVAVVEELADRTYVVLRRGGTIVGAYSLWSDGSLHWLKDGWPPTSPVKPQPSASSQRESVMTYPIRLSQRKSKPYGDCTAADLERAIAYELSELQQTLDKRYGRLLAELRKSGEGTTIRELPSAVLQREES